jgi:hypothetical protein
MDMKHLEEKILAYLDGSLGETEREEVLREVSASPAGRRMLEEHLRVNSLITQAAKPTSAPLDAQRALAEKLPMMATYLPYLAPQSSRKTAGVWYRSTKYVAAVIGGAALIGGSLWYALSNSNTSEESQSLTRSLPLAAEHGIVTPKNTQNNASTNSATNATTNTPAHANEHNTTQTRNGTSDAATLHASNANSTHSVASTSGNVSHPATPHTSVQSNALTNDHNESIAANRNTLTQSARRSTAKTFEQTPAAKAENDAAALSSENAADMPALHAVNISNAAAQRDTHYEIPHFIAARQSTGYIPLRGFVNFQERQATLRNINPTKHITDSSLGYQGSDFTSAFEAELAYEVSPWVSIGLRGGSATFYQLQEHSYSVSSGDLTRTYEDALLNRVSATWLGVSVRYEFNPEDKVRLAATGIAGAAFIPKATSPMGSLELSGTYNIWSFLALEAAASVDGSSVAPQYDTPPADPHGVVGYITTGPQRSTILTTAFGGRVGLVFHP